MVSRVLSRLVTFPAQLILRAFTGVFMCLKVFERIFALIGITSGVLVLSQLAVFVVL